MAAGDVDELVSSAGPDPSAPAHVVVWEWDPPIGDDPTMPKLGKLGPDDFVAFPWTTHGASVGTFE